MKIMETSQWLLQKKEFRAIQTQNNYRKTLYQYPSTKQIVSEQFIKVSYCDYQKQLANFQWRYESNLPLIKVYSGSLIKTMRQAAIISILISTPKYLLTAVKQLSFSNSIRIIKIMLETLPKLTERFGLFLLTENMIGLRNNKVKIWINQDFTINHPQYFAKSQTHMINELFSIIKNKTEITEASEQFFSYFSTVEFTLSNIHQLIRKFQNKSIDQQNNQKFQFLSLSSWNNLDSKSIQQRNSTKPKKQQNSELNFSEISNKFTSQLREQSKIQQPKSHLINKFRNRNASSLALKKSQQTFGSTEMTSFIKSTLPKSQIIDQIPTKKNGNKVSKVFELNLSPSIIKQGKKSLGLQTIKKQTNVSNCWSENLCGMGSPKCSLLAKNNWTNNFQVLLHSQKNLGTSIVVQDSVEEQKKKIDELKKLRLEKFGGSQQVFQSIIQDDFNDREFDQQ